MMTFLPFSDIQRSAEFLDNKRLFNQINEAKYILKVVELKEQKVLNNSKEKIYYENHPAILMWVGYKNYLKYYINTFIDVCIERRGNDDCSNFDKYLFLKDENIVIPWWNCVEEVNTTHLSRLFHKNSEFYIEKYEQVLKKEQEEYIKILGGSLEDVRYMPPSDFENEYKGILNFNNGEYFWPSGNDKRELKIIITDKQRKADYLEYYDKNCDTIYSEWMKIQERYNLKISVDLKIKGKFLLG